MNFGSSFGLGYLSILLFYGRESFKKIEGGQFCYSHFEVNSAQVRTLPIHAVVCV